MSQEEEDFDPDDLQERLTKMKVVHVRLDEALTEGGLEVARIKCCFDLWWSQEDQEDADD